MMVTAPASDEQPSRLHGMRGRILFSVALTLAVLIGLSLFADSRKLATALRDFRWPLLVPILLLTLYNYLCRFIKWQYYLRLIGVRGLPTGLSARIFLSGFAMAVTPGKVGEVIKSLLLKEVTGTPIAETAPIILVERLTDGIAMLLLASIGLAVFHYGVPLLATIAVCSFLGIFILQRPRLMRRLIAVVVRVPLVGRVAQHLETFYASTYVLMSPKPLALAAIIGFFSWLGECAAFYLVLVGLGFAGTSHLFLTATFILAAATLIGSVSLLPGGLGVAEVSVTAMLLALLTVAPMSHDVAVAATLLIRFCTLWFGVGIGVIALATVRGFLRGTPTSTRVSAAETLAGAATRGK